MRLFLIVLVIFSITAQAEDDCKLYPQLSYNDCIELLTIQKNYAKYNNKKKHIAQSRIRNIKQNLLTNDERTDLILYNIKNINTSLIPIKIINYSLVVWKDYLNLPLKSQKEVIKYALGEKDINYSEEATQYLENKEKFILRLQKTQRQNKINTKRTIHTKR